MALTTATKAPSFSAEVSGAIGGGPYSFAAWFAAGSLTVATVAAHGNARGVTGSSSGAPARDAQAEPATTNGLPVAAAPPAYITSELGKRLWAIRQRIIASGARLLDADEIDREVRARRGETADEG